MPHQCTNCGRTFADGSKEMLSGCPDCGGNKFQFVPGDGGEPAGASATDSSDPASADAAGSRPADATGPTATADAEEGDSVPWPPAQRFDGESPFEGFPEWPDSARRPEDRSSSASEGDRPTARPRTRTDAAEIGDGTEDTAQADARSAVVPPDELPDPPDGPESIGPEHAPAEGSSPAPEPESTPSEPTPDSDRGSPPAPEPESTPSEPTPDSDRESPSADGEDEPPEHGRVVSEPSGDRPSLEELREELNEQFESIKIVRPGEYELNLMELYNREEYIVSLQEDGRYVIEVPDSWRDAE